MDHSGLHQYQTVCGTLCRENLGHCQPHEHIYITSTVDQLTCELTCINNLAKSIEEIRNYRRAGGMTAVDANPLATGRDPLGLKDISRITGVNLIAVTGYHIPKFYPRGHWIYTEPEERLEELFVSELQKGMNLGGSYYYPEYQTDIRAGLIKAVITSAGMEDAQTVKCLTAAGKAAVRTGASIMVHTENRDVLRMIDFLAGRIGVATESIIVCHVDRQVEDLSIHEQVASTGVFMEYDTITLLKVHNNASEIRMLLHMIEKGFLDQILISTDPETNRLNAYGGLVGIDYILKHFLPLLKLAGVSEEEIRRITVENPARALKMDGVSA